MLNNCTWISFSDRKPADHTLVTVFFSQESNFSGDTVTGVWIDAPEFWDSDKYQTPTFWMPTSKEIYVVIKPIPTDKFKKLRRNKNR